VSSKRIAPIELVAGVTTSGSYFVQDKERPRRQDLSSYLALACVPASGTGRSPSCHSPPFNCNIDDSSHTATAWWWWGWWWWCSRGLWWWRDAALVTSIRGGVGDAADASGCEDDDDDAALVTSLVVMVVMQLLHLVVMHMRVLLRGVYMRRLNSVRQR
jgi:hypothetical protein